jgi:hypothetical protein
LAGWPQDCLSYEVCDRGLCVPASGAFEYAVISVTCEEPPQLYEIPPVDGPAELVDLFVSAGCRPDSGVTIEARSSSGFLVDSCVTVDGFCSISADVSDVPLTLTVVGLPPEVAADNPRKIEEYNTGPGAMTFFANVGGFAESETGSSPDSDVLQPAGDLAYAVKNGEHWDIWVYNFDTQQNIKLTNEPNSDQWAPAYSHDGARLAYLSDVVDGTNQVWLMNPDGTNQRQVSSWVGSESIQYVAWSPDDTDFILTLTSNTDRRLVRLSANGGAISDFIPASSAFATTSIDRTLLYVTNNVGTPSLMFTDYTDPFADPFSYAEGDAPNLTFDGSYMAFQVGEQGGRHIEILKLGGGSLPNIPRVGDDSNPVWLTQTHTYLAFVSSNGAAETIQINRLHDDFTTPIEIAPHERIWYLSKRFSSSESPDGDLNSVTPEAGTTELTGRVHFGAISCPQSETAFSVQGPGISIEIGPVCETVGEPHDVVVEGPNGYRTEFTLPATLYLPMGTFQVTDTQTGTTASFELVPTDEFIAACTFDADCMFQWWVYLEIASEPEGETIDQPGQSGGTGSIEVHVVDCPAGFTGPDFFSACHDNGNPNAHWNVIITGAGDFREILSTFVESTPGPVIARIEGLPPGTYGVNLMTKFVEAPAYVFCSPDQGETVLVDQFLDPYHDPVLVPVYGQAVVCDWNKLY